MAKLMCMQMHQISLVILQKTKIYLPVLVLLVLADILIQIYDFSCQNFMSGQLEATQILNPI